MGKTKKPKIKEDMPQEIKEKIDNLINKWAELYDYDLGIRDLKGMLLELFAEEKSPLKEGEGADNCLEISKQSQRKLEDWEIEFDREFGRGGFGDTKIFIKVKSLIRQLLQKERDEIGQFWFNKCEKEKAKAIEEYARKVIPLKNKKWREWIKLEKEKWVKEIEKMEMVEYQGTKISAYFKEAIKKELKR